MSKKLILMLGLALGGCAINQPMPQPGDGMAAITARFGQPTAVYPEGSGQALEFATGPMGQRTWMAHIGADGKLLSLEQVLTGLKFATLKIGSTTREQALHALGRPAEKSYLPLKQLEVWSYRYKENDVWNSLMHLHFDQAGILQLMQNGPDPMYEEKRFYH